MSNHTRLKRIEKQARTCARLPDGYLAIGFEGEPDLDEKLAQYGQLVADGILPTDSMFIILPPKRRGVQ